MNHGILECRSQVMELGVKVLAVNQAEWQRVEFEGLLAM